MKKHRKKVIIITISLICIASLGIYFVTTRATNTNEGDDMQYIALQNIALPNGSTSIIEIASSQATNQGWIGASLSDLTQAIKDHLHYLDSFGVYVQDTLRDSPAQVAGILPGDIITRINDTDTNEVLETIKVISALNPGDTYSFTVFRQGEYLNYTVVPKQNFS